MKYIKKIICVFMSGVLFCSSLCISSTALADESKTGEKTVSFGMYPQSRVADDDLVSKLNNINLLWNSYDYYSGKNSYGSMTKSDYMKYADVSYNGDKYRAVTFTQYRPEGSINSLSDNSKSQQYINGYMTNTIYWFRYEPVKWVVLDEAAGMLMSLDLLDAQSFSNTVYQKSDEYFNNEDGTYYANNYFQSSLRKWLNNDFYNCAFSTKEKNCIKTTTISNKTVSQESEKFECEDSSDKVFVLSYEDVTNPLYGFNSDFYEADEARTAKGSDYAKAQGLYVETINGAEDYSYWSLRTAGSESVFAARVSPNGFVSENSYVYQNCYGGVRPAICVDIKSCVVGYYEPSRCTHNFTNPKTIKKPTCSKYGQNEIGCSLCSYKYTEPIKPLGHKYASKIVIKATCSKQGKKEYTCQVCSAKYSETIKMTAHKYTSKTVKPTYFEQGYTKHTCVKCKKTYKDKKTAKLKVKSPTLKSLSSKNKKLTVKWSKVKSVQGYEIQYSTDKKFKKNKKTIKVIKGSQTSKTISKLTKNKKYYVRVRAYKYQNKRYARSSWSKVKYVKIK